MGNDTLDGGDGIDTAIFSGKAIDYNIVHNTDNNFTISHVRGAKVDGVDTLTSIERVQFSDQSFNLAKNSVKTQTDFAFVIDTTGSMGPYIAAVKSQMANLVDAALKDGTVDAHISIVGFKDPGETEVILNFTGQDDLAARKAAAVAAINGIFVDGGGDTPEGDNSGLIAALRGDAGAFRDTAVIRRIALFTDAPVKDTYLASTVQKYAADIGVAIDSTTVRTGPGGSVTTFAFTSSTVDVETPPPAPVQIFAILVGSDSSAAASVRAIAEQNGGSYFTASDGAALTDALFDIIEAPANSAPTAITLSSIFVPENAPGGTLVGTLSVTDPDASDTHLLALTNDGGGRFVLNGSRLEVAAGAVIDFETTPQFTLRVSATDSAGNVFATNIVVTVRDVPDTFLGTPGNDVLRGDAADNDIQGLAGADVLSGDAGDDKLAGGAGNDSLIGGTGKDVIDGGADIDTAVYNDKATAVSVTLSGATNAIVSVGGIAEDTLRNVENLTGGAGNDRLTGDSLANTLNGGGGDDTLVGGTGNDRFIGGTGKDAIDGGVGVDTAFYVEKTDAVVIALVGATNATVKVGGVAEDTLRNIENLTGGSGNDTFTGDLQANALIGGDGVDRLIGGAANDSLTGGTGRDILDGGADIDTAFYTEKTTTVSVVLNGATNASVVVSGVGEDTIRNVENLSTGIGNDILTGDGLANLLSGGGGNDTLSGGIGDDNLLGGAGIDRLTGGAGIDALDGGADIDVVQYGEKTVAVVVTLNGAMSARVTVGGVVEDTVRNVENVSGGSGDDNITGDGLANALIGAAGDDTLAGGAGNDSVNGGLGKDVLDGGAGIDIALFTDKTAAVAVTLRGATNAVVTVGGAAEDMVRNIENVIGGTGHDNLTGDGLVNIIVGGDGNDTLKGAGGNDSLNGGAGIDRLIGGAGGDKLSGGLGGDSFIFAAVADTTIAADGRDVILDFNRTETDRIDLRTIDADINATGDQAFSFIGASAFSRHAGELRFLVSGEDLTVYGDVNGDGAADFSIRLNAVNLLQTGDFML